MKKFTLTFEQMKHLEELGLDTTDACMFYHEVDDYYLPRLVVSDEIFKHEHNLIPAYNLQDILEKLPIAAKIEIDAEDDKPLYFIEFGDHKIWNNSLLEGAYEMLCYCIENGYLQEI